MRGAGSLLAKASVHRPFGLRRFATETLSSFPSESTLPSSQQASEATQAAFTGQSRKQLQEYHALVRIAEVAEALRSGYQDGTCASPIDEELRSLLRATRARPSLLTPLGSSVGILLRHLPIPSNTIVGDVGIGLRASLKEALDSNVRRLVEVERARGSRGGTSASALKRFMKEKRDGLGMDGEDAGSEDGAGVLAQGTKVVCSALLWGAKRL
ncbi:hypothetical protein NGA_0711800 [Nannochloropsis gaditana CCMP526]|uniref:Uncharacterized protein n=1 Tax=Nannochloropsis gaditana TaxID=72520 RepID=W7TLH2_9STRA|nr:hypothetical protein NGA_0711800 [Nannochloropsis gaditana CCMP526]EKU23230.1 hypothetical protein NGA_0711800 [Nannochloropsis gaditana CCMP526]EWM21559.1 hypothetical protein Naga_100559g3 [Nannochloropsis gaditana]|eukprot:XP_005852599.1 hypothetical protein NGA_0711800 [Nannochloropsis gaditana CCMP526]